MKKVLMIRMSSLGDVILASAALGLQYPDEQVDWLTSQEYASLFQGHPRIRRLITFDRKTGAQGWKKLCESLYEEGYDEVVDLHSSLRTWLLSVWFGYWHLTKKKSRPEFRRLNKQKWKFFGYFIFKKFWPRILRPTSFYQQVCRVWKKEAAARPPQMQYLVQSQNTTAPYYCVMPSGRWKSKEWPVEKFVDVIRGLTALRPVILGAAGDRASVELVQKLEMLKVPHDNRVGTLSLPQVATCLSGARFYLGNDTGLAHLSEAVGTPAHVTFGPTVPDMGYGPWKKESRGWWAGIGCQPCGKDGRFCHRITKRYECFEKLSSSEVLAGLREKK